MKRFWPALISKGLRLQQADAAHGLVVFLACPDFKGIKTPALRVGPRDLSVSGLP